MASWEIEHVVNEVTRFNAEYPVGTRVFWRMRGETTGSSATVLNCNAWIRLVGVDEMVRLDAVLPLPRTAGTPWPSATVRAAMTPSDVIGQPQRSVGTVSFPVEQNDDDGITCVACNLPRCELVIKIRGDGRRIWAGLHEGCRQRMEET